MNFIKKWYQNHKQNKEIKKQVHKSWENFATQRNNMIRVEDDKIWDEVKKISNIQ